MPESDQRLRRITTNQFEKDLRPFINDEAVLKILEAVEKYFQQGKILPSKYKDHLLVGNWRPTRECHLLPDLLLVYFIEGGAIYYVRLGTHSELYGKPKNGERACETLKVLRKRNKK